MKLRGMKWVVAGATLLASAACEQGKDVTAVEEFTPAFAVTIPAIGNASLTVCKEGPTGNTYTFQLSSFTGTAVKDPATVDGSDQFTLSADQCKRVATGEGTVLVQEINQPAGTVFYDVANYVWYPANGTTTAIPVLASFSPNPSFVNLTSSQNFGNDFGRLLLYRDIAVDLGCTLTLGYWKTHNDSFQGGAATDPTWALLSGGLAEETIFFLSGQTWFEVFWTPVGGNAYYNLAHQYMAAVLNQLAGASVPAAVQTALNSATTLFNTYTPAQIAALSGSDSLRRQFIALAGTLGAYNEGLAAGGPDHCIS